MNYLKKNGKNGALHLSKKGHLNSSPTFGNSRCE